MIPISSAAKLNFFRHPGQDMEKKSNSRKKVLIATGGSGGHLLPAQQLANSLHPQAEILFAGYGLNRSPFFERRSYPFFEISAAPLSKKIFPFLRTLFSGVRQSIKLLRSEKPDIVIGFGSFHCFPLLLASLFLRKRIVLFEANCQLGKVNRFFSPFAKRVAMQFSIPSKKISLTPLLPWKESQQCIDRQAARSELGLFPGRPVLLVFGGSQGAAFLNQLIPAAVSHDVQVIHLTGKPEWVADVANAYRMRKIFAVVKSFETNMPLVYAAADAAICRSGAGTLAELIRYGVPALLIPFPHATEDHQRANANFLAKKIGGAKMLLQEEAHLLSHSINALLSEREEMQRALHLFAKDCEGRIPLSKQILEMIL